MCRTKSLLQRDEKARDVCWLVSRGGRRAEGCDELGLGPGTRGGADGWQPLGNEVDARSRATNLLKNPFVNAEQQLDAAGVRERLERDRGPFRDALLSK